MCILLINFRTRRDAPIVVAANRDEYYDRPSEPPQLLQQQPRIIGGRDGRAGGTWLGINEFGLVAALTNRHVSPPPRPRALSRGILCANSLRLRSAGEAVAFLAGHPGNMHCNPFSMVLLDAEQAWSVTNHPEWTAAPMSPGWHALANTTLDAADDARVMRALRFAEGISDDMPLQQLVPLLEEICRDHGRAGVAGAQADALCIHGSAAGTRSASILLAAAHGPVVRYRHAEGPPCSTPFRAVHVPWQAAEGAVDGDNRL